MNYLSNLLQSFNSLIWGIPLLLFLLGTGAYLTILLRGIQFRYLLFGLRESWRPSYSKESGDISHFEALMTTLAGAIGTGTIVGVATGISIGGVGSIFWMWVTALLGMATKYAESLLAVHYRVKDDNGEMVGGPMEYIERGLGWRWLAILFAIFGSIAAVGTGNFVQANSIAAAVHSIWHFDSWTTGFILACLVAIVTLGGVKSIGRVAAIIVPFMALFYLAGGIYIMIEHFDRVPAAFSSIFYEAFNGRAAVGGAVGTTILMTIQQGVARAIFATEAGLGISTIASAAARTNNAPRQATVFMTGGLISTVIVCTVTGLVLIVTGVTTQLDENGLPLMGASMAIEAFSGSIPGGNYILTAALVLFAYTTMLAWAFYGEKCAEYLFGRKAVRWYRMIYALAVIPGAAIQLNIVWMMADAMNGLMAIPNLIAIIALSTIILRETNHFEGRNIPIDAESLAAVKE